MMIVTYCVKKGYHGQTGFHISMLKCVNLNQRTHTISHSVIYYLLPMIPTFDVMGIILNLFQIKINQRFII